jgi:hypothetical protein
VFAASSKSPIGMSTPPPNENWVLVLLCSWAAAVLDARVVPAEDCQHPQHHLLTHTSAP